jgi:hypothetical protein
MASSEDIITKAMPNDVSEQLLICSYSTELA